MKPARIRRLYKLSGLGLHDEVLLAEVGWGLHDRCRDALLVCRAVQGEVPCPECGETVERASRRRPPGGALRPNTQPFPCPECGEQVTWQECRDELRSHPRCFDCLQVLRWDFAGNRLICRRCGRNSSWQAYCRSVSARVWLACARCHKRIRQLVPKDATGASSLRLIERVQCPECSAEALHAAGRLSCPACGYDVEWRKYRRRMKRRAERLKCSSCGHEFTWQSWRKRYAGEGLMTGMPAPLGRFLSVWPGCRTPQMQMIEIDRLLHAVHARGALAPVLIKGSQATVSRLLDELAD